MGNKQTSQPEPVKLSPHNESLSKLFEELAEVKDEVSSIRKEVFQNYFRSEVNEFDEPLFLHVALSGGCNRSAVQLTRDEFVNGFEVFLDEGATSAGRLELYFAMFSDGHATMSFTDLVEMFHISRSLAVVVAGTALQGAKPESPTIADVWARSIMGDDDNTQVDCQTFCSWAKQNCPRVFDGIHCWMRKMLLHRGSSTALITSEGFPAIPFILDPIHSHSLLNTETLWILSTILPPCFIRVTVPTFNTGSLQSEVVEERIAKPVEKCKEWTLLYDSLEHGQSLNRFKHHCMGYRGPTVALLKVGKEGLLIAAIDVEWRESSSSWGNSDCRIIQVRPKFRVLRAGPNLIFFNERARGLPSGIVLGQTSRPCVTLDADLRAAKLHYHLDFTPQIINKIEVWGCGGQEVKAKQQKQQQWERKQAEKLQKVKRPGRWDDNPDKAILDMAGVTTNHSQR